MHSLTLKVKFVKINVYPIPLIKCCNGDLLEYLQAECAKKMHVNGEHLE